MNIYFATENSRDIMTLFIIIHNDTLGFCIILDGVVIKYALLAFLDIDVLIRVL